MSEPAPQVTEVSIRDLFERLAVAEARLTRVRRALLLAGHSSLCGLIVGDETLCAMCRLDAAATRRAP